MNSLKKNGQGVLLIAEIGGNHEGDFGYAKKLTQLAIDSGVDVIKFQIYQGDNLVSSVTSPDRNAHFKRFELKQDEHLELADMVRSAGISYNASVWDIQSLHWIEPYLDFFKVGSGDLTAYPLLKWMAQKSKPIILSTGLASIEEIEATINYIRSVNSYYNLPDTICLLQCTTNYPTADSDVNLSVIPLLKEKFNIPIGYSHHNLHSDPLWIATILGAEVLEFHFTDIKEGRSFRDHQISLTCKDVFDLKDKLDLYNKYLGKPSKSLLISEAGNNHHVSFRRAIYPNSDLSKGDLLIEGNLCTLRPNIGIDARDWDKVIGKRINRNILKHEPLDWSYLD